MPDTRGLNFYRCDPNLAFTVRRYLSPDEWAKAEPVLDELGALAGSELDELAHEADKNPPVLRTHNRRGERVDEVVYSAAYRRMEEIAFGRFALAACSHRPGIFGFEGPVPHVVKYALTYLFAQAEFGLLCPVNMTDSLTRVLRLFAAPGILDAYLPRLTSRDLSTLWQGAMFLTEQAGGSDVGATETVARRVDQRSDPDLPTGLVPGVPLWRLYGDKWFCSNVDAELILTLARPEGAPAGTRGLGLFLVPRFLPDGSRNRYTINRLKDKLGTRDMASGEVTLEGALAYQIGELDRGFRQMAEMINASRLSNAVRSAGMMRRAFLESLVHARGRRAFGQALIEFPLMRQTLLEMLLDVEGAVAAIFYTAHQLERADAGDTAARRLVRILTPLLKATVTKRARTTTGEAMEVRGGNGYIEEWVNPRLLRDSHLGSIWEGTTKIVQLDVLRAIQRQSGHEPFFSAAARRLG
ncbi:MAG TPA: acyl-CoA dehydrogenase family protein, partial [Bacillota bacterium]